MIARLLSKNSGTARVAFCALSEQPARQEAVTGGVGRSARCVSVVVPTSFFALQKGRGTNEPRAKLVGNGRDGTSRRIEGEANMRKLATWREGEKILPPKNFTPVFSAMSERDAAKEFSAVILDFSVGELAQATNRTKDTAKCWKAGRAFPNGVSLLALAAEFDVVDKWCRRKTGRIDTPESVGATFAMLEQAMSSDTPDGRAMRARFQQLLAERVARDV